MGLIKALQSAINPKGNLSHDPNLSLLEKKLGYTFKDKELLREALTHPSFDSGTRDTRDNQRLEFLGDSVVGCILAKWLYCNFTDIAEGELSRKKSLLARRDNLANLASNLNLQDYLIIGKSEKISRGNLRPSVLEDAFEALIGAILLDSDYLTAERIVMRWQALFISALEHESVSFNPKGKLQELLQSMPEGQKICYKVIKQTGPDHNKRFQVQLLVNGQPISTGSGKSKKKAEEEAAQLAIKEMTSSSSEKD
jgi:ribonuclease-3